MRKQLLIPVVWRLRLFSILVLVLGPVKAAKPTAQDQAPVRWRAPSVLMSQPLPPWWSRGSNPVAQDAGEFVWLPLGLTAPEAPEHALPGTGNPSDPGAGDGQIMAKEPRLVITKSDDVDPVPAGSTLRYTISYTNVGDADARAVVVTETYDPRLDYQSAIPLPNEGDNVWVFDRLAKGESGNILVEVRVDASLPPSAVLTNIVKIDGPKAIPAAFTETTTVALTRHLSLTLDGQPNPVNVGADLVYHIHYEYQGNAPIHNVILTMSYDENVTFFSSVPPPEDGTFGEWLLGELQPGSEGDVYVTVVVDAVMDDGDIASSRATISGDGDDASASESTAVYAPRLSLAKLASPNPVSAFSPLTYTLIFSNLGHAPTAALEITDALPAATGFASCWGLTCSYVAGVVRWLQPGRLEPGDSHAITAVVDVQRNLDSGTILTNIARVRLIDAPTYAALSQIETTVVSSPAIWLSISNGKTSVEPGELLTYKLDFHNSGNASAHGTTIVATPPSSEFVWNIVCAPVPQCEVQDGRVRYSVGSLPGGEAGAVNFSATVRDPLPVGTHSIAASAIISTATPGDPPEGNTAQDQDLVTILPDLVITADYAEKMPWPGKRVTYTLRYSNVGHMVATDVRLTATQPPQTDFDAEKSDVGWESRGEGQHIYPVGALNVGEGGELLFVLTLTNSYFTSATSSFDAVFQITGDGGSYKDRNASDNVFAAPLGVPNLTVVSAMADPAIWHGNPGLLEVTIMNTGPGVACGVYLPHVGCTPFALDVFLDPSAPPRSFPVEGFGDCYVFVDPVLPGLEARAVISFTLKPELRFAPGFCGARPFEEMWLKVDNWDPGADPFPGAFGLVPESNEYDNLFAPGTVAPDLFLPVFIRNG